MAPRTADPIIASCNNQRRAHSQTDQWDFVDLKSAKYLPIVWLLCSYVSLSPAPWADKRCDASLSGVFLPHPEACEPVPLALIPGSWFLNQFRSLALLGWAEAMDRYGLDVVNWIILLLTCDYFLSQCLLHFFCKIPGFNLRYYLRWWLSVIRIICEIIIFRIFTF